MDIQSYCVDRMNAWLACGFVLRGMWCTNGVVSLTSDAICGSI